MKSTILLLSATAFAFALGPISALGQQAEREVTSITRHQLIAAKELEHFRLYEQTTHPTVDDSGTFLLGGGGSVTADNFAIPTQPTKQSAQLPLAAGVDYLILVSCDEDCQLLNVRVFDADGRLAGEDLSTTNDTRFMVKQVQLVPAADQNFRVETEIACRAGSRGGCSFAIGVNTK